MKHLPLPSLCLSFLLAACSSTSVKTTDDTLGALPAGTKVTLGTVTLQYDSWSGASPEEIDYARKHEDSWIDAFRAGFEEKAGSLDLRGTGVVVNVAIVDLAPGSQALRYWVGFGAGSGYAEAQAMVEGAGSFKVRDTLSVGVFGGRFEEVLRTLGDLTARRLAKAVPR